MDCALCDRAIDESIDSLEHVILNALGGRRRVRGLCRVCNNTKGGVWDGELAQQLKPLALLFGVSRQDGRETPPEKFETTDGRSFWLTADGSMRSAEKPFRKVPKADGTSQIHISGHSMRDVRRTLRKVVEAHPEVDYEKALESAKSSFEYLDVPLKMTLDVGGTRAGRSIVKSAFCLAVASGVEPSLCTSARAYLTDMDAPAPFGYYYARDLIRNRPPSMPLHSVAVSNRETGSQLLGYVEYFGLYRMVVLLAEGYSGPDVHTSYSVNPMTGSELDFNVDLSLSPDEVAACFAYERIPEGSQVAIMNDLVPVAQRRAFELERDRVLYRAFRGAMEACGVPEGGELPAEKFADFSRLIADQMTFFLSRYLSRRPTSPPKD